MSAALYPRAMLHHQYGVAPEEINWMQGSLEEWGRKDKFPLNLPEGFPLTRHRWGVHSPRCSPRARSTP